MPSHLSGPIVTALLCNLIDWQNDEPIGNARDCQVDGTDCVPRAGACGIGFELAVLLPPLMWAFGRFRRPRR